MEGKNLIANITLCDIVLITFKSMTMTENEEGFSKECLREKKPNTVTN